MTPTTEVKPVTFENTTEAAKKDAEDIQSNIDNHKKAAKHHELAAEYHHKAAQYHEAGNHSEAEQSAFIAQGHYTLAGEFQTERSLLYNW